MTGAAWNRAYDDASLAPTIEHVVWGSLFREGAPSTCASSTGVLAALRG
jgi:hypothetical protein